jgi:hypothetical protein
MKLSGYFLDCKTKAAPRLELGVKVLQTLALPLGYAAVLGYQYIMP